MVGNFLIGTIFYVLRDVFFSKDHHFFVILPRNFQAFVSVSLFNAMRFPLNMMPQVAIMLFQVLISVRRISGMQKRVISLVDLYVVCLCVIVLCLCVIIKI